MKTHVLCSIYDNKAEIYFAPQLFRSPADFIRQIQVAAKDKNSMLHQHPSDYELIVLCDWSETEAILPGTGSDNVYKRLGSVLDLCPLE